MPFSFRPLLIAALLVGALHSTASASIAGFSLQDSSIPELLKRISNDGDKVEKSVFGTLAKIGTEESLKASQKATGKVKKEHVLNSAYGSFVEFTDEGLRKQAIAFLAKDAAKHRREPNRRAAARGLARFGTEASSELLEILREHREEESRRIAAWPIRDVLAELNTAESFGLFQHNVSPNKSGRTLGTVETLAGFKSVQAIDAMLGALSDTKTPLVWRELILERLATEDQPAVNDYIVKLTGVDEFTLQLIAIETVGRRKIRDAEDELFRQIKHKDPGIVRASVAALSRIVADSDDWRETLRLLAKDKRPAARMGAAIGLAALRSTESIALLYGLLGDTNHAVRMVAVQESGNLRRTDGILPLIERLEVEQGRFREQVAATLRLVTGKDFGTGMRWRSWWTKEGGDFVVPDYDKALAAERQRQVDMDSGATQASFYGLNIVSKNLYFVLDTSGSMAAETNAGPERSGSGGSGRSTRIEVAKAQLTKAILGMDEGVLFNMIFFSGGAKAWKRSLTELEKKSREDSLKYIAKRAANGGTAVYDGLALAFEDDRVDTIYLMTDGAPSAGEIVDPGRIRKAIARMNSTRMVQINCISIGQSSALLRDLAADSGGTYREVL